MEEDKDDHCAAFSWWSGSHSRRHHSQWLQATLSDLESRIKMILNIIQDGGDTFSKRAETFYKRRPELINMVQDLYRSYCSLAERYDQLRSESFHAAPSSKPSPFPSSKQQMKLLHDSNKVNLHQGIQIQTPTLDSESRTPPEQDSSATESMPGKRLFPSLKNLDVRANTSLNRLEEKIVKNVEVDGAATTGDLQMDKQEKEKMRNELRLEVSRLIEENRRQQNELIRRNEEKRDVIRQLRSQVDRLLEENRALRSYLPAHKVEIGMGTMKRSKSRVMRLKGLNCIGVFRAN